MMADVAQNLDLASAEISTLERLSGKRAIAGFYFTSSEHLFQKEQRDGDSGVLPAAPMCAAGQHGSGVGAGMGREQFYHRLVEGGDIVGLAAGD